MSKFTPGPWKVTGEPNKPHWVQTKEFMPIAEFNFVGDGNQVANAQLIACAPELLEALKKARSFISKEVNSGAVDWYVKECAELRFMCDQVINKAQGGINE